MKLLEDRNMLKRELASLRRVKEKTYGHNESLRSKVEQSKLRLQEMWAKEQTLNEKIEELSLMHSQASHRNLEL